MEVVKKDREDEDVPRLVGKDRPEDDFKRMIEYRREDLTDSAVEQMKRVIVELLDDSYDRAVECLSTLRRGCVQEDEGETFNEFIVELKGMAMEQHMMFWTGIVQRGLTLINREETNSSRVTAQEAMAFLGEQRVEERQPLSDEDYLDDIE